MKDQDEPQKPDWSLLTATELTPEVISTIQDMMHHHGWDKYQENQSTRLRQALTDALEVIIRHVPPCPDRSAAIRKIREARMDCNSAITHRGKY